MKMHKKLGSLLLALCVVAVLAAPAHATEITSSAGTGQSALTLNVTPATFSVTVPTTLTFAVSAGGEVTCPTGAVITNNGGAPVKVTGVTLAGVNGWTIKAWADDSFKSTPINTKQLMLKLNGTAFGADGSYNGAVKNAVIAGQDSLALTFAADFAVQGGAVSGNIATITFTIGWNTAD